MSMMARARLSAGLPARPEADNCENSKSLSAVMGGMGTGAPRVRVSEAEVGLAPRDDAAEELLPLPPATLEDLVVANKAASEFKWQVCVCELGMERGR